MRLRKPSRTEQLLDRLAEVLWWQRATALAVPAAAGLGAAVYAQRKRVWRGIAFAASAVEEALRDGARKRAAA
jgi:hypothetical protein